jgi:hypothetical protein
MYYNADGNQEVQNSLSVEMRKETVEMRKDDKEVTTKKSEMRDGGIRGSVPPYGICMITLSLA